MKKWGISFLLLFFILSNHAYAYEAHTAVYRDLGPGDWSAEAVYTLSVLGMVSGYEDGSFRPDQEITREAFIKMLIGAAFPEGPEMNAALPYTDVAPERWSYPYLAKAEEQGLIGFLARGSALQPDKPMLREEVAALAGRYLLQTDAGRALSGKLEETAAGERKTRAFPDAGTIDQALEPYVYVSTYLGVMEGDDTGSFRPKDTLTRKQAAAILYRLIDKQVQGRPLELTGFYAIKSYGSKDHIADLDRVIFGWANLDYSPAAGAKLNRTSTEYKVPEGVDEVLELVRRAKAGKDLMIYADGGELTGFLEDERSWPGFLAEVRGFVREGAAYDGVCLDFEGLLDAKYSDPYARFIAAARKAWPDLTLTVAVPPATYYKGYDLDKLGAAADRVLLMAYDFTHRESGLPSAPLPHVEEALAEALRHVPKDKVILGISKQANQWTRAKADGSVSYYAPAVDQVENRLAQPETVSGLELPFFLDRIFYEDGKAANDIWYENEESMAKKLWLARFHGIKGVSFWYMGNLTVRDWDMIKDQH